MLWEFKRSLFMLKWDTVKPALSRHSKIDKTKILKTNGSLMKVESIAECSPWSILQNFWLSLSDNRSWKPFLVFFEWPLKTGFTVQCIWIPFLFRALVQQCDFLCIALKTFQPTYWPRLQLGLAVFDWFISFKSCTDVRMSILQVFDVNDTSTTGGRENLSYSIR